MEREFKADQRFPFGAPKAIVIRAGDAGAIRLIIDGKDLRRPRPRRAGLRTRLHTAALTGSGPTLRLFGDARDARLPGHLSPIPTGRVPAPATVPQPAWPRLPAARIPIRSRRGCCRSRPRSIGRQNPPSPPIAPIHAGREPDLVAKAQRHQLKNGAIAKPATRHRQDE